MNLVGGRRWVHVHRIQFDNVWAESELVGKTHYQQFRVQWRNPGNGELAGIFTKTIWQRVNQGCLCTTDLMMRLDEIQLGATGVNNTADEKVWPGGERDRGRVCGNSHRSSKASEQTVTECSIFRLRYAGVIPFFVHIYNTFRTCFSTSFFFPSSLWHAASCLVYSWLCALSWIRRRTTTFKHYERLEYQQVFGYA